MTKYKQYLEFCTNNSKANTETFFTGLQRLFNISEASAMDIWYAAQRSWFKPEMVDELIRLDKAGEWRPNLQSGEFIWNSETNRFLPEPTIQFLMKSPDCIMETVKHLSEAEKRRVKQVAERFIKYDELIKVELNTQKGTCTVLPVDRW